MYASLVEHLPIVRDALYPAPRQTAFYGLPYVRVPGGPAYRTFGDPAATLALVYAHGNGDDVERLVYTLEEHTKAWPDVLVVAWEYPGYGVRVGDGLCTSPRLCDELTALVDHLCHVQYISLRRIFLYGHSLGTGPCAWLAARVPGFGGLILHSPFARYTDVVLPWPLTWLVPAVFDNATALSRVTCPVLVLYGARDELTTAEETARLLKHVTAARSADVHRAEAATHNTHWDMDKDIRAPVLRFLQSHS